MVQLALHDASKLSQLLLALSLGTYPALGLC